MSRTSHPRRAAVLSLTLLAAATAVASGCTTKSVGSSGGSAEMAAMGPMLSVERFLQAANARDLDAMARLFGTYEGPVEGERRQMEVRMATIAEILRHQDYRIVSDQRAAGRTHPTNRIGVDIRKGGQLIRDVPFLVVRTESGTWLIEEIGLEKITSS